MSGRKHARRKLVPFNPHKGFALREEGYSPHVPALKYAESIRAAMAILPEHRSLEVSEKKLPILEPGEDYSDSEDYGPIRTVEHT